MTEATVYRCERRASFLHLFLLGRNLDELVLLGLEAVLPGPVCFLGLRPTSLHKAGTSRVPCLLSACVFHENLLVFENIPGHRL